jgi:hypothetical protein
VDPAAGRRLPMGCCCAEMADGQVWMAKGAIHSAFINHPDEMSIYVGSYCAHVSRSAAVPSD